MSRMKENIAEITSVLVHHYDSCKHEAFFTPWGIAYYWDQTENKFSSVPTSSELGEVMPALFQVLREQEVEIIKPEAYIPESRSVIGHYGLLAMRNRTHFNNAFLSCLDSPLPELPALLSDQRLLHEALTSYPKTIREQVVPETADLLDFLLHYQHAQPYEETLEPRGQYRYLVDRIQTQYEGTSILKGIETLADPAFYSTAMQFHHSALEKRTPKIRPDLQEAYQQMSRNGKDDFPKMESPLVTSITRFLGKRRVRLQEGLFPDWSKFFERHLKSRQMAIAVDPNDVIEARIRNILRVTYFEKYKSHPDQALAELRESLAGEQNPEIQKALNTTLQFLQKLDTFDRSDMIHHTLTRYRRKL